MPARPDLYIWIPDWDRFQHYRDRNPIWIKTYVDLLSDDAYLDLSGHRRAVLHGIWLEYARCGAGTIHAAATNPARAPDDDRVNGRTMTQRRRDDVSTTPRRLPGDARTITRRLGMKVSTADLQALNHAGFIELVASGALAERLQVASEVASGQLALPARARAVATELEAERETEVPQPSHRSETTAARLAGDRERARAYVQRSGWQLEADVLHDDLLEKFNGLDNGDVDELVDLGREIALQEQRA